MFYFVVHRLRFLARVPLFPQLFDSLLLMWTCMMCRQRIAAMEMLETEMLKMPGMRLRVHRFGGVEFSDTATKHELGHIHGNALLDVKLDREKSKELIGKGCVRPHHIFPKSAWVSFQLKSCADVPFAKELLGYRQ
ncbi:MAG: luciferase family protein [Chthoniobacterales bacterium]